MMWLVIFGVSFVAFLLSLGFLCSRVGKFSLVRRLGQGRKWRTRFFSALILALIILVLILCLDAINCVVVILNLMVIWLICDGVAFAIRKLRGKESKYYISGGAAVLITVVYLCAGWYLAHHVWQTVYDLETDKPVEDLRVIMIADSHLGVTFHGDGFKTYMEEIQKQDPDVVLIVGDFVDDGTSREDMLSAAEAFRVLHPTYGTYFVYGNHDRGYSREESRGWMNTELVKALEDSGVIILEDELVTIGEGYAIWGRQDNSVERFGGKVIPAQQFMTEQLKEKYVIVMDHQPYDYENLTEAGPDLVLSGHTHGGQMIPINHVGEWIGVNDCTYGHETHGKTDFIVTSGISCWAIKFKTGCRSEYVIIDIKGSK